MSLGKNKCRILKEIRQKIADENDIPYVTHECRFKGDCSGTCPRCESELRYLEKQLAARAAAGKRVAIAALCAGMTFGMAGCSSPFSSGGSDKIADSSGYIESTDSGGDVYVTTGEVAPPEDGPEAGTTVPDENTQKTGTTAAPEVIELSGDVAFPGDTQETTEAVPPASAAGSTEEIELLGEVGFEEVNSGR